MIVDFHTHILPPSFQERRAEIAERDATFAALFANDDARMATADDLIDAMDQDGVDTSVVLGYGWCDKDVARESNDYLLASAERFPGRIVPFCSVHPRWGRAALEEVERCVEAGAAGIGELHPTSQRIALGRDRALAKLMALAAERGLPVVVHGSEPVGHAYAGKGTTHPAELLALICRFPKTTIVCAHWGGGLPFYALMPEVRAALANVYFDSAASPFLYEPGVFGAVAGTAGTERMLFGSDFPLMRAHRVAAEAIDGLPAKDAAEVLGGNAARLLGPKLLASNP
ncbi:MAG: amidohydrolase [Chloroflexi bacterium]|nr:amidohydrolase [Chloroflexota bacterium]